MTMRPMDMLPARQGKVRRPSAAMARIMARVPKRLRASFSEEQITALDGALDVNNLTGHAINLRLTLFGLAYLVILAGPEQHNPNRHAVERALYPMSAPGNAVFLTAIAGASLGLGYAMRLLVPGG